MGANSGASNASRPVTAAWQKQVLDFVSNYPKAANAQQSAALNAAYADTSTVELTCDTTLTWKCSLGSDAAAHTWLVLTDGTARQWLPALAKITQQHSNVRILFYSVRGCQNSLDEAGFLTINENQFTEQDSVDCAAMHAAATALVAKQRIEAALLIDNATLVGSLGQDAYGEGLLHMVQALSKHTTAQVIGQLPRWGVPTSSCLNKTLTNLTSCYANALSNNRTVSYVRDATISGGGSFIDSRSWLCGRNICPIFIRNNVVTIDGGQLTPSMATVLAPVLYENIKLNSRS